MRVDHILVITLPVPIKIRTIIVTDQMLDNKVCFFVEKENARLNNETVQIVLSGKRYKFKVKT